MSPATAIAVRGAWIGDDSYSAGCLCHGMARWCRTGMHKYCRCPHEHGQGAEAVLVRGDGSYVIDRSSGRHLPLHLAPKPCRLHTKCPCRCHWPTEQVPLW